MSSILKVKQRVSISSQISEISLQSIKNVTAGKLTISTMKIKQPVGIYWKISEKELQAMKNITAGKLTSRSFAIPDTNITCWITIYPNGNDEQSRGQAWISFSLGNDELNIIEAEYTFFIESANISRTLTHVYKKSEGWGFNVCSTEAIFNTKNRFIVDGEMAVKLDGYFMVGKKIPECLINRDSDPFFANLWNEDNKDFVIVAEGKEIKAHRLILSARSPTFAAMFEPHKQEAQEERVTIEDFSFEIVEYAIQLCYHQCFIPDISLDNQLLLLAFFDKYEIQTLKDDLEKSMITVINEMNVCRLVNCSIAANASKLQGKCSDYLYGCLKSKAICDFDILDKEFAVNLLKKAFCFFSD